jgi:hypothetical protein
VGEGAGGGTACVRIARQPRKGCGCRKAEWGPTTQGSGVRGRRASLASAKAGDGPRIPGSRLLDCGRAGVKRLNQAVMR